jgi:hypothetical protein
VPDELRCTGCGRTGSAADAVTGWSLSTPPRPVGSTAPRAIGTLTALCPDCARRHVRVIEGRLDP